MGRRITIGLSVFLLIGLAVAAQLAGYMNPDNAWLLTAAERVTNGEILNKQVVETNPPLVVYIMQLPVLAAHFLHVSPISAFTIFVTLLVFISLLISFRAAPGGKTRLILVFSLIFLPGVIFGEREHFLLIFILPYFVSLFSEKTLSTKYIIVSAIMAAIGFALKPFFLLLWGAIMLTQMVLNRRWFAFLTLQNIIIGALIFAYILFLIFIEKTYVQEILPWLVKYYSGFSGHPFDVWKESIGLIFLYQLPFWIIFYKSRKLLTPAIYYSNFACLASIALIILQHKVWMNYFYPPNFFGLFTNALLVIAIMEDVKPLWNRVAAIVSGLVIVVLLGLGISSNFKTAFRIKEDETTQMVEVFNKYAAGKIVYSLSFDLGAVFPAITESDAIYKSRYGHLWMLPGMYAGRWKNGDKIDYRWPGERLDDETKLIGQVVNDIAHNPPELIVVTVSKYTNPGIGNFNFDFIEYFSLQPEFKKIWKNYVKITKIGNQEIYLYKPANGRKAKRIDDEKK